MDFQRYPPTSSQGPLANQKHSAGWYHSDAKKKVSLATGKTLKWVPACIHLDLLHVSPKLFYPSPKAFHSCSLWSWTQSFHSAKWNLPDLFQGVCMKEPGRASVTEASDMRALLFRVWEPLTKGYLKEHLLRLVPKLPEGLTAVSLVNLSSH